MVYLLICGMKNTCSLRDGLLLVMSLLTLAACNQPQSEGQSADNQSASKMLQPKYITESLPNDSDDPAVWVNPDNPGESLIIGTDKSGPDGGLYVFDLKGKIVNSVTGLNRPNNVDLAYGMVAGGDTFAIAVTSERLNGQMRAFRVPEMTPVDGGGMPVFEGEPSDEVMGIALYSRVSDGAIFAIVSHKTEDGDPVDSAALFQYRLVGQADGTVKAEYVRRFGIYSGVKEIEAIAADDERGLVYFSDEGVGVRQYYADPDSPNVQLKLFATAGFAEDHEGISIYPTGAETGYITVSDQGAQRFHIFDRITQDELGIVDVAALESDGSESVADSLNADFPAGLFVAMSDDRTFHLYDWRDILSAFVQE